MGDLFLRETKRKMEVIDLHTSFKQELSSLDTIDTITVTVSVFSGADTSPSDMKYQSPYALGATVHQRIKGGVIGVVYNVEFIVLTTLGYTYSKVTRLAILPNNTSATPVFIPLYLTTRPYSWVETAEYAGAHVSDAAGTLQYMPVFQDQMQGSASLQEFTVYGGSVSYTIPASDDMQGSASLTAFTVYGSSQSYSFSEDPMTGAAQLLDFTVYGASVSYSYGNDHLQGSASLEAFTVS